MIQRILYFVFLFISTNCFAQKTGYPSTLLWRISGNGLTTPSYLFGTMHLQDKRLFNFGDSVYLALESVDGFAVEIDFKEYMDSMFLSGIREAQDKYLVKQKVKINNKALTKSADSLLKKLGIDKNNLTKKDLKKVRDHRINKLQQKGEMPTIVDGYLFGLALRHRKWVGAVEDVSDQFNIIDELGADLSPEEVLMPDEKMNTDLEQMIRIYEAQDLQRINEMTNEYDVEYKNTLLVKRNFKMARRMDSLSNLRRMFFAVGAAHLPGDSGVIYLLRNRGFTVEPVFSSKKMPAEEYAAKLEKIPWYTVKDENKLFTVQMPGIPSQFKEFGEAFKMKMFFDITTMTFYMTGLTIGQFSTDKDFENAFNSISERMGNNKKIIGKNVSRTDLKGKEASFEKDDIQFRLQLLHKNNSLFMLIAGSSKKANLNAPDVNRFFSSFVASDVTLEKKEKIKFHSPEKGFSIMLPGEPKKNEAIDRQAENTNWNFLSYDYLDNARGLYYLIQVRDLKGGYYLTSDTLYFNNYIRETSSRMDTVLKSHTTSFKNFPALYYDALYNKTAIYKTFHVVRGNRVYIIVVGGSSKELDTEAESLFQSLNLEEYSPVNWKKVEAEGFSTYSPSEIEKFIDDSTEADSTREHFFVYNAKQANSYEIIKDVLSTYYWVKDDNTFFADRIQSYKSRGDSIISEKFINAGGLKALELLIQKPGSNNIERVKMFVNADTLYSVVNFSPVQYSNDANHLKFFSDFKITNEMTPTIFTNKAGKLINALTSTDSLKYEEAFAALSTAPFSTEDLPLLHNALLQVYSDSIKSSDIQNEILKLLKKLGDKTTVNFVANAYKTADATMHFKLLEVLANIKTEFSYKILKQLLLSGAPKNGNSYQLKYALSDSLDLAKTLYPEILTLNADSSFADLLVTLTDQLIDSNLVSIKDIQATKDIYLEHAKNHLALLKTSSDNWWYFIDWVNFIGKFNDKESNNLLQEFLQASLPGLKLRVALVLIDNNQAVPSQELLKIAAEKNERATLYYQLLKKNKIALFPTAFAKQQSLAESDIFQLASEEDDYEVSAQTFIGERVAVLDGVKKRFFLFKVTYTIEDDEKLSYLGVAGPYDIGSKEINPFADHTGLYWNEEFNKSNLETQFKAYINQLNSSDN